MAEFGEHCGSWICLRDGTGIDRSETAWSAHSNWCSATAAHGLHFRTVCTTESHCAPQEHHTGAPTAPRFICDDHASRSTNCSYATKSTNWPNFQGKFATTKPQSASSSKIGTVRAECRDNEWRAITAPAPWNTGVADPCPI
mmetsp:Transcript_4124/g.9810  ORF Transcript_4124/g.9810 Transcript_4124/m.9810 type:complete len:142 (-) Transcript_4124:973-1398(-)